MGEKKRVYFETTFVSYLTARPSLDIIAAAKQATTREWWERRRTDFELYVSQLVADEAARGDPDAARRRIVALQGVVRPFQDRALQLCTLSGRTVGGRPFEKVALSSVHGMDFLLTWNCSHIANAERMEAIESVVEAQGYECPRICTPHGLLGQKPWGELP